MKAKQWAGLVTNASPYILPPGAAVAQDNLHCRTPGQLEVRDGMRKVLFSGPQGFDSISIYPYAFNGQTSVVALKSNGTVHVLTGPFPGVAPAAPVEPTLSPSAGQTVSSYTGRFYAYGQEAPK